MRLKPILKTLWQWQQSPQIGHKQALLKLKNNSLTTHIGRQEQTDKRCLNYFIVLWCFQDTKHNLFYNAPLNMHPPRISNCLNNIIISVNVFFYCFDSLNSATALFEHFPTKKNQWAFLILSPSQNEIYNLERQQSTFKSWIFTNDFF